MMFDYKLTRSKRRTVALYIRDGGLEVRAPLKMAQCDIDRIIATKEAWIRERLAKSQEQSASRAAFCLNYGDTIIYRDKPYPITVQAGNRAGFNGGCFYMPPDLTPQQIKSACVQIYRLLAKRYLSDRTQALASRLGSAPNAVKINSAKTRWGSCSTKKNINFSWRLIMADDAVIDYVIIHELAHLSEMNHSARFWRIVESVLPDYKERKARLKELQSKLRGEDWD